MNKKFKIGDRVKLKCPQDWGMGDSVGTIVGFDNYVRVDWEGSPAWKKNYPHLSCEIKHTMRKGEQLLFNFMC